MSAWHPILRFDDVKRAPDWPLSCMYHQESKLGDFKGHIFREAVAVFAADEGAVRQSTQSYKQYPARPTIALPRSRRRLLGRTLRGVLSSRRTRRGKFSPKPMTLGQIGSLLELSCGETGEMAHPEYADVVQRLRAWPSGGALYPIEVYLIPLTCAALAPSVYHYQVKEHRLSNIGRAPSQEELHRIVYADGLWDNAGVMIVLTGVFGRTQLKYGERGYRFVLLDAGHLGQNVLLVSEEMGLAAIPLGGFHDDALGERLELDAREESPLYVFLVGNRGHRAGE